jgi:DNA polymerase III epsilon subunit family exonuclease
VAILAGVTVLAVDTETTGFNPAEGHRLVELARVAVTDGRLAEEWSALVNPARKIPPDAARIHGIGDAMVEHAPGYREVAGPFRESLGDLPLVFHNAPFDLPFLIGLFREAGAPPLLNPIVDTLGLARGLAPQARNSLGEVAQRLQLPPETAHRALGDARTTARVFVELAKRWESEKGVRSLAELAAASQDVMRLTARR